MNLPITSIVKNADGSWTYYWSSTGANTYRIVYQGVLQLITRLTNYTGLGYDQFPLPIEVVPNGQYALSELFSPIFIMQWYLDPGATTYQVQNGDATIGWSNVSMIAQADQWVSTYQIGPLEDETSYSYQIIAADQYNNQAPPKEYTRLVVTPPDSPDGEVAISYNANMFQIQVTGV